MNPISFEGAWADLRNRLHSGAEITGWSRNKEDNALLTLEGCVDFNGSSIISAQGIEKQPNYITEHVGEAIGLSVVNRIHDLTEADWTPIPQESGPNAHKTLDYEFDLASDGNVLVQVENKGSAVKDNRQKTQSISQHKSAIGSKKADQRAIGGAGVAVIRYGTITVLDKRHDGHIKCWLTDPDGPYEEISPLNLKLLRRLYFLARWISLVATRSQLASALMTRVRAVRSLENPFTLDNVPLLRGSGAPFEYIPFDRAGHHTTFMSSKARIKDGPAGGHAVQLDRGPLMFLGFREDLLELAS